MSAFTLAISCLTTSNLSWFMDLTFQVPMQYCSLQHQTLLLSPVTSTTGYCFCFGSIPSFFLPGVISPLISSSILGTYWPEEFLFHYPIILPLHTVHGVLKARILKWSPFPSPVDHILSDLSIMTRPSWVAPQGMAWFHWVRQGFGPSVIRLTSFLWLWFQNVCPLMPSCNTYHLTWVSLTLDDEGPLLSISSPSSWPTVLSASPTLINFTSFSFCFMSGNSFPTRAWTMVLSAS